MGNSTNRSANRENESSVPYRKKTGLFRRVSGKKKKRSNVGFMGFSRRKSTGGIKARPVLSICATEEAEITKRMQTTSIIQDPNKETEPAHSPTIPSRTRTSTCESAYASTSNFTTSNTTAATISEKQRGMLASNISNEDHGSLRKRRKAQTPVEERDEQQNEEDVPSSSDSVTGHSSSDQIDNENSFEKEYYNEHESVADHKDRNDEDGANQVQRKQNVKIIIKDNQTIHDSAMDTNDIQGRVSRSISDSTLADVTLNNGYSGILPRQPEADMQKLTVVLDMDETLLHSEFGTAKNNYRQFEERKKVTRNADFEFEMVLDGPRGPRAEHVRVYKRPGLDGFLDWISQHFEVVVFTAAIPQYAAPVLDRIDPNGTRIKHRHYRNSTCKFAGQQFVKDISLLGRSMDSVVLIDNNPMAMIANPDNAIPIPSFFDCPHDRELEAIAQLLAELNGFADVRQYLKKRFSFRKIVNEHFNLNLH